MHLLAALILAPLAAAFPYVSVNGCSGGILAPAARSADAPALVFTNGHCVDFRQLYFGGPSLPAPTAIIRDVTSPSFLAERLISVQSARGRISLTPVKMIFAAMGKTDVAIFETKETYAELAREYAVVAQTIAFALPPAGRAITVRAGWFNRDIACAVGAPVSLREGPYRWPHAVRLGPACEIYPGVSGSPIVDDETGAVFALANTHYSGEGALCSFHNPCEIDERGTERAGPLNQAYGISLAPFAGCFNPTTGNANFSQPGCPYGF